MSYVKNTLNNIIEQSKTLLEPQSYVDNKRRRSELADFYKKILNLGGQFPPRPTDMRMNIANTLYNDVSSSCPSCVQPSVMKETVRNALRIIYKYIKQVEGMEFKETPNLSVHDLKPNI